MQNVTDPQDRQLFEARAAEREALRQDVPGGVLVGDYVEMKDGSTRRFTHSWGESIQVSCRPESGFGEGSFYLDDSGDMECSGAMDPSIPIDGLEWTGEMRDGACWIFHHDWPCAGGGVDAKVPCRVYRQN